MIHKIRVISAALAVSLLLPINLQGEDPCMGVTVEFIKRHAPISDFSIASRKPVHGLCEVIISYGAQMVPLYAGRDFIISGGLYREGVNITGKTINSIRAGSFKEHLDRIKEAVSFSYTPKVKSGKSVYMFTDPLCGYCNNAIKGVRDLAEKHGAVFYFILLSFHGEKGKAKAVEAVCRKFTFEEYIRPDWKGSKDTAGYRCAEGEDAVSRGEKLSDILGIAGVPAFYIDNGTFISGSEMILLDRALGKSRK